MGKSAIKFKKIILSSILAKVSGDWLFYISVVATPEFNFEHFQSRMAFHKKTGSIPAIHQSSGYSYTPGSGSDPPPHHHHQVLYVCRGHCSGPQCDFSQSLKQWHSSVWLDGEQNKQLTPADIDGFHSQVVASAPKAFEKLDQKKQTLLQLKGVLAQKLENKHKQREKKLLKQKQSNRSASAMMVERPDSRSQTQERCSSAMTVLKSSNYGNVIQN